MHSCTIFARHYRLPGIRLFMFYPHIHYYLYEVRLEVNHLLAVGVVMERARPDLTPGHVAHGTQLRSRGVVVPGPPPQSGGTGAVHVLPLRVEGDSPASSESATRKQHGMRTKKRCSDLVWRAHLPTPPPPHLPTYHRPPLRPPITYLHPHRHPHPPYPTSPTPTPCSTL